MLAEGVSGKARNRESSETISNPGPTLSLSALEVTMAGPAVRVMQGGQAWTPAHDLASQLVSLKPLT